MRPDRTVDQYAAHQYGVFTRSQALSAGLTDKMVAHRVASGAWVRVAPATYSFASASVRWERQLAAAVLSHPGAYVGGRSAARLHDFSGFGDSKPEIVLPLTANARSPLARVIRSQRFNEMSTVRRAGFVTTSEAETVMQLARSMSEVRLESLVDSLLARKTLTVSELAGVADASSGVPGITRVRKIVDYRSPTAYQPPTSELERLLFGILDNPRLPPYVRQMPMKYQQLNATVDAYIPDWKAIVEGDGRRWHQRRNDMMRDRRRDNEAIAHGLVVLRFDWDTLRDHPDRCLDQLLRTGAARKTT